MAPKKLVQSVSVRVPPPPPQQRQMLSPSSSSASSRILCNRRPLGCCAVPSGIHYPSNFKRSAAPVRVMFYQNDSWNDFPNRVIEFLRSGFVERKVVFSVEIEGSTFLFDFMRMLQIDSGCGTQRSIAWIDENGKCFFPTAFVSENLEDGSDSPKSPMIINRVTNLPGRVLGKRKINDVDADDEVTSSVRRRTEDVSLQWGDVKLLKEDEQPYKVVAHLFLSGMRKVDPTAAVTGIRQTVRSGPLDKARFDVFQKQIEITKAARGGSANVIYAWLGASPSEIRGIFAHGFGVPGKVPGAQRSHGVGLHLSHLSIPHFSAGLSELDDNGEKHAVLCRVILGNVEKVEAGSQQCYPSSVEFDTGADDPKNPKWYVVWSTNMNRHVLPECVVSYKSSLHVPAQLGNFAQRVHIEALMPLIQSHLPPSKVQQVSSLVCDVKAGKLARNDFLKQFRSLTGEEVMLSVFRELRG